MSALSVFVTGTDTDVGKTWFCQRLITGLGASHQVAGYKPIAAGTTLINGQQVNLDALALQQASSIALSYADINPIVFHEPIAPHIAAHKTQSPIDAATLARGLQQLQAESEIVVVEGAGGWLTPLSADSTFADWVIDMKLPVIMVVDIRVGCLNHAQLTAAAIQQSSHLIGWVANVCSPDMQYVTENIAHLDAVLGAPMLAHCGPDVLQTPESWTAVGERVITHLRDNC